MKEWEDEIRGFLLGRLQKERTTGTLQTTHMEPLLGSILSWWIFEGKRYEGLSLPLGESWGEIRHMLGLLQKSWSPRWRIGERPEGDIDWGQTLARGGGHREWMCRVSGAGLQEEEWWAVQTWCLWILALWKNWQSMWGHPIGEELNMLEHLGKPKMELRRSAHIAQRSRWPFLRQVVAASLRPLLEPQELNQLPLPRARSDLFELLCIVRILRALGASPSHIRWLNLHHTRNRIQIPGVEVQYQLELGRERMLNSLLYNGSIAHAMRQFDVSIPTTVDAFFRLAPPRAGFHGIVLEAKSGQQDSRSALLQLLSYAQSIPRQQQQRFLIWGIIESQPPISSPIKPYSETGDTWIFSGPDDVEQVVRTLLM